MVSSPTPTGIYVLSAVLIIASAVAVGLRYKARRLRAAPWKTDDWLVTAATLFLWGLAIILIYGASVGTIGTHTKLNPETGGVIVTPKENQISEFGGLSQILTVIALGFLKFGIVMFYRRIFISDGFRRFTLGILVLIVLWTLAFFLATVLECNGQNLNLLWKSIVTFKTQCQKYKTIQLAHCVTDVATDLIVLSLPLPSIWALHTSIRQKVVISLMFLIGFLSVAAGTARLVIVAEDIVETTAGARDVRGVETNVLVWTFVEVGVGIVAACLPTFKPLFDNRSVDSVVASVRSKTSLKTLDSKNSRNKSRKDVVLGTGSPSDVELVSNPNHHYYSIDEEAGGIPKTPALPPV
ncbi:hypothetical protein F4678DRAFT_467077 [Xylaria arbuscula]|nr:hypothetical protein F4678DRAFT_467077 [Xylaria arbuscula]